MSGFAGNSEKETVDAATSLVDDCGVLGGSFIYARFIWCFGWEVHGRKDKYRN
jgi:hypothetical protein